MAQHSFHMLLLLDELHPDPPLSLYRAIIHHDLPERWIGDSPAAIKQMFPDLAAALKAAENIIIERAGLEKIDTDDPWMKALDNLEFLLWCDDQAALGNVLVKDKRQEVEDWILDHYDDLPGEIKEFYKEYRWERTRDYL